MVVKKRLGELLVEQRIISSEQLKEARAAFLDRRWDEAELMFQRLAEARVSEFNPAKVSTNYLTRIAEYRNTPSPDEWVGAFAASEK